MSRMSIIISLFYIFLIPQLPHSSSHAHSSWLLALISGFVVVGIVARDIFINIRKNNIKHPYVFGLCVAGAVGAFTVNIVISKASSLETMIGACIVSSGVIILSVIVGVTIGKLITLKAQKKI